MKNSNIRAFLSIPAMALGLSLLPATTVQAADALAICAPGIPFAYPAGGSAIPWNPDQGGLGTLTNAQAVAAVSDAFNKWEDLPQSTAAYSNNGFMPVDIDVTNFVPILNPVAPDGLSPIVFDEDGSIFALLFGPGSGILGFAGPDFGNNITCELLEGSSFLNGPAFSNAVAAEDIMVHEFGHYSNLGHVELNGQLIPFSEGGDNSGAGPDNTTFGLPSSFVGTEVIETMYPFYFGDGVGTRTPHADDIASIATIYPDAGFASSTGSISGTVYIGDTTTRLSGVNVIARRLDAGGTGGDGDLSFTDAVSTFSGAYTDNTDQADPNVGVYTLSNLTPGATYAVFVDTVTAAAGRFSNPITQPLPGPEDYWDSAEAGTAPPDDPLVFTGITVAAGSPNTGVDIRINQPGPGDSLPVGDDGSVQLALPFAYEICGQEFGSVYVNANGHLTFGAPDGDYTESAQEFLDGPPRIAGLWHDLQPFDIFGDPQGSVYFTTSNNTFTVTWEDVPKWGFFSGIGSNTFSIELKKGVSQATVDYDGIDIVTGIAGVSCGLAQTGGVEPETELKVSKKRTTKNFNGETAIYEWFSTGDNDLENYSIKYNTTKHELPDVFESNNSFGTAAAVTTPLNTAPNSLFTELSPSGADIDFFSFEAQAGQYLIAEVTRGQIDSVLGLFNSSGVLIAANDDTNGLLSRIEGALPADDTYTLAVTFCCDYDFDGVDPGQGEPFDGGRYVLDLQVFDGIPLTLGDETVINLSGFGFSFPFDGNSYSDVFVSSNGFISFGAPIFDYTPSVSEFENEAPRVAPLWVDLNATGKLVVADTDFATELTISFIDVPEWPGFGANNFSVTLHSDGNVEYNYGSVTATTGLIGAAQGGGAPSTATDFSVDGGGLIGDSPVELFTFSSTYDLANPETLVLLP